MTDTTNEPTTVRRLGIPAADALADLASAFNELQTVLRCCERLVAELAGDADEVVLEALWTTALLAYVRSFTGGDRGLGLTEADVEAVPLSGEILEWHNLLRRLRKHYTDPARNPRERFAVGAALDSRGRPVGIAVTAIPQPRLDDVTVRQTGALAYELSKLVDRRITEHQERVLAAAEALSAAELDRLPVIEVAGA
jgi:hypothetical protein